MPNKIIREKFLEYYPDEDLKKWFDPLILEYSPAHGPSDGVLPGTGAFFIKFPHKLFSDWFNSQYREKFENTLATCLGCKPEIKYTWPDVEKLPQRPLINNFEYALPINIDEYESASTAEYTFDNFIYNRKNQFPFAAAKSFADGSGYGPLILFGGSGSGKTHLLNAIYNEARKNVPEKIIFFKQLSELGTFFSNAFKNGESPLSYLRQFKCVLIDDLDMLKSMPELQEHLAAVIEYSIDNHIRLGISIRQKSGVASMVGEKLCSLIEGGLCIELKNPDLDVKRQYVDYLSNKLKFKLKKDDALALARMYSGFRQIHGALLKVSSFMILSPQAAEAKLADILRASISDAGKRLTPDHIINSVAEYFKLPAADISGKKRSQDIVFARHIAMYLCRDLLGAQLGHIGACFSDRDHSSVLYSVNKIKNMIDSNKDTNNLVTEVKNIIFK